MLSMELCAENHCGVSATPFEERSFEARDLSLPVEQYYLPEHTTTTKYVVTLLGFTNVHECFKKHTSICQIVKNIFGFLSLGLRMFWKIFVKPGINKSIHYFAFGAKH